MLCYVMALSSLLLIMHAGASTYTPEALLDQVHDLPGISDSDVPFNHFSGYLTIKNTKKMHYWFMESERNPSTDALSFWTNGGPVSDIVLLFPFVDETSIPRFPRNKTFRYKRHQHQLLHHHLSFTISLYIVILLIFFHICDTNVGLLGNAWSVHRIRPISSQ